MRKSASSHKKLFLLNKYGLSYLKKYKSKNNTSGVGGQAPAIAQELCKDWKDSRGNMHPGLYDEDSADMKRWAEAFPHAIGGSLHILEPTRYRNQFFESAKKLIPLGDIKFSPRAPKGDYIVLDDGSERKLNRNEIASLIQMDMMKEEMACMTRFKTPKGAVSFGLSPEKSSKMHDDRNYVAIMACWWIDQLQQDSTLGEDNGIDFMRFFNKESVAKPQPADSTASRWLGSSKPRDFGGFRKKNPSPFSGENPFSK